KAVIQASTTGDSAATGGGNGPILAADLGTGLAVGKTTNGKDATFATATIVAPGANNDLKITATTAGKAYNGKVIFTSTAAAPGQATPVWNASATPDPTLTFNILPDPTNQFVPWRYSLGNNLKNLSVSQYSSSNANVTGTANGTKALALASVPAVVGT